MAGVVTSAGGREETQSQFRTSDGIAIRYAVTDFTPPWKKPDTIVLLHAAMGTMNRFRQWVPHLAGRWRVVRWDMRGHGDSEIPPTDGQLSIERLSRDYVELLDHLGVERAHCVGSSTGGIIGMLAAVEHPERFLTLASYAAIPGLAPSTGHNDYGDWTAGLMKEGVRAFLRRTVRQRFHVDRVEPGFVDWFIEESARNDPAFLARFVRMMTGFDFGHRLKEIACPCLFVVPSNDPVHSMENYAILRTVPDHRFIVLEDRPHNITDAEPERCVGELVRFLDDRAAG
ncbi:MAG: alpha/beta hydrolase [Alphaproteobacteria bacterium]|nr:alpha/beta hydrolase [Alphaproteobacteria bacterium]